MPLVEIATASLAPYLNSAEIDMIDADLLKGMISSSADEVIGYVNSNQLNARLKTGENKVPQELVTATCILVKHRIISSMPGTSESLEGSARSTEYRDAVELLRSVARGEYKLSPWAEITPEEGSQGSINGVLYGGHKLQDWTAI